MTDEAPNALAVYGTLRPGEENHWVVRSIPGEWVGGTVRGWQFEITWGAAEGYPGFIADPDGPEVEVAVIRSDQLDRHWRTIDDFEGPGYTRRAIAVTLDDGTTVTAQIYEALTEND